MADLRTKYMGFELRNPIIIGSSGLTDTVEKVMELEQAGAGAVVLKSLFEEQILHDFRKKIDTLNLDAAYPEAEQYIIGHTRNQAVEEYLQLIRDCRNKVKIPVFASINCLSLSDWLNFALDIENAGASGLELNLFMLPSDPMKSADQNENAYLAVVQEVIRKVSIPVAVKVSPYFTGLANTAMKFAWTGIKGLVIFNRYYSADIDIHTFEVVQGNVFSAKEDIYLPLRWTAILSDRVSCDIAATGGVHDGQAMIKLLLAGAKAVQICSVIYDKGSAHIGKMLKELENYMTQHEFGSIGDFNGKMSMRSIANPAAYERVQFMKHFSGVE